MPAAPLDTIWPFRLKARRAADNREILECYQKGLPMFGFDKPEDGSALRFGERVSRFKSLKRSTAIHHFWWVIHNCVAHPMIGLAPINPFFEFHDWTSRKINPSGIVANSDDIIVIDDPHSK